jgi:hypothetical protein
MNDKLRGFAKPHAEDASPSARESWRMFGIMAEFVEATERLAPIRPAVSRFSAARASAPDSAYYALTESMARLLSDAGFCGDLRRRPGGHGSRQQGRVLWQDRPASA